MTDVIFHSMPDSAYLWTAMHVADEKGVAYDLAPLVYRSPEHLALHPFAKMPVMQHGSYFLYETAAIAHYLDKNFPGPSLQPESGRAQAEVIRWVSIVNGYVFPVMNRFLKERLVRPAYGFQPDHAFIESAREPLMAQLKVIEETLARSSYVAGDAYTIADSFLLPHLLFFTRTPEGAKMIEKTPNATAWLSRMRARASFAANPMSGAFEAFALLKTPSALPWPIS